ncbi:hypothetical protein E1286_24075 [Nonomuraea terrae]|uniref:Uncharacterized protein n=1 Tax=Nonomuraea terrae TaxID=2530383 RepID=A0A4R4YMQ7_9ACTN|nr:hypothetical protein [Nonomuraea terrae]TDD45399.1 hypothetical protein E1286_24075 [Nonomuraea terrae]
MSKNKRNAVAAAAGAGWATALAIIIGTFFELSLIVESPALLSRIFSLVALAAAVLTCGLWFERSLRRRPAPVLPLPVETAYSLGMKAGAKLQGLHLADLTLKDPLAGLGEHIINGNGQQDTPPFGLPRLR